MPIRVLVVDDHKLIRDTITELLDATDDMEVVGQCGDGSEVLAAVERSRPQVVLMDLQMPQVDGLTAARAALAAYPELRVVVLTGGLTAASVSEASAVGAAGYLLKEDDAGELAEHVRRVAAGGTAWHPHAAALLGGPATPELATTATAASPYVAECPPRFRQLQ